MPSEKELRDEAAKKKLEELSESTFKVYYAKPCEADGCQFGLTNGVVECTECEGRGFILPETSSKLLLEEDEIAIKCLIFDESDYAEIEATIIENTWNPKFIIEFLKLGFNWHEDKWILQHIETMGQLRFIRRQMDLKNAIELSANKLIESLKEATAALNELGKKSEVALYDPWYEEDKPSVPKNIPPRHIFISGVRQGKRNFFKHFKGYNNGNGKNGRKGRLPNKK